MITIFYKIRVFEFIIFRTMFTVALCTKALVWCGWMGKTKLWYRNCIVEKLWN